MHHSITGQYLCPSCNERELNSANYAQRKCNKCFALTTSRWYTDPIGDGDICRRCYRKGKKLSLYQKHSLPQTGFEEQDRSTKLPSLSCLKPDLDWNMETSNLRKMEIIPNPKFPPLHSYFAIK
jgi:ribosomal protein L37AE/L43A